MHYLDKLNKTVATSIATNSKYRERRPHANFFPSAPVNFGDTNRNDSAAYGYPDAITFDLLYNTYRRSGFFNALVDIIPERCFSDDPYIVDGDYDTPQETKFEKEVNELVERFQLWR